MTKLFLFASKMSQLIFSYVDRKKGSKKGKIYPRRRDGYTNRPLRRNMTPSQLASYSLNRALEKFSEIVPKERRDAWVREFKGMDQLKYMHMPHFAIALILSDQYGSEFSKKKPNVEKIRKIFSDETIEPLLSQILIFDDLTNKEKVAHKEVLLSYIRAISYYRQSDDIVRDIDEIEEGESEDEPEDETSPLMDIEEGLPKVDLETGSQRRIPVATPNVVTKSKAKIKISDTQQVVEESGDIDYESNFSDPLSVDTESSPDYQNISLREFQSSVPPARSIRAELPSQVRIPPGSPTLLPVTLKKAPKIRIRSP